MLKSLAQASFRLFITVIVLNFHYVSGFEIQILLPPGVCIAAQACVVNADVLSRQLAVNLAVGNFGLMIDGRQHVSQSVLVHQEKRTSQSEGPDQIGGALPAKVQLAFEPF